MAIVLLFQGFFPEPFILQFVTTSKVILYPPGHFVGGSLSRFGNWERIPFSSLPSFEGLPCSLSIYSRSDIMTTWLGSTLVLSFSRKIVRLKALAGHGTASSDRKVLRSFGAMPIRLSSAFVLILQNLQMLSVSGISLYLLAYSAFVVHGYPFSCGSQLP